MEQSPDLVVPPDLSIYDDEEPGPAIQMFWAHTTMHRDYVLDGIASIPPFGFARASDIERFAAWVRANHVPGAFIDLQNRQLEKIREIANDLAVYRHLFPEGFVSYQEASAVTPVTADVTPDNEK